MNSLPSECSVACSWRFARRVGCLALLLAANLVVGPNSSGQSYLAPQHPDGVALLAPPPIPGSSEQASDLASTRAVFKSRTSAEEARAKSNTSSIFNFAPAIGPTFAPGKFPKMEALMQRVVNDVSAEVSEAKKHWRRPRPYEMDPDLAFGTPEDSFSYPSGHSTRGTVQALVLAELFPAR